MPGEWEPPADLCKPTRYPEANLAIRLLSCEILGHEVYVSLGRFITEHSLYTIWFMHEVKGAGQGIKESMLLAEVPLEQTRIVYEAWKEFERIDELDAPNEVLRERRRAVAAELAGALKSAAATLVRIREENS